MARQKRILPFVLGTACIVVATAWPGWRVAFAQFGGYQPSYQSYYLGCEERGRDFVATLIQGPGVPEHMLGNDCASVLNSDLFDGCRIGAESQSTPPPKFASLMRIECE